MSALPPIKASVISLDHMAGSGPHPGTSESVQLCVFPTITVGLEVAIRHISG